MQLTTAGTGIRHSEFNSNKEKEVHFLQIWVKPYKAGLTPAYHTKYFSDEAKTNKLALIVADTAEKDDHAVPINAKMSTYACLLSDGVSVSHVVKKQAYLHLIMTSGYDTKDVASIKVNDEVLQEGDGLFVKGSGSLDITSMSAKRAEFLLFDIE